MRWLALTSYGALVALLAINTLCFADLHGARKGVVLAVELLPLLVLAPGMGRGNRRTHSWACFVVNLYFIKGVLAAFDPSRQVLGGLEVLLSLTLFISALLFVRWRGRDQRTLAAQELA